MDFKNEINSNNQDLQEVLDSLDSLEYRGFVVTQSKTVKPTTEDQEIVPDEGYTAIDSVTVVGDPNLLPENIRTGVSMFGVLGSNNRDAEDIYYSNAEDALLTGTLSGTYTNSRVTEIGKNAFDSQLGITSVNFPNVTTIGTSAFYSCRNLTGYSFPNVVTIDYGAFQGCLGLTTFNFPKLTSLGSYAFGSTNITSVSIPNVSILGSGVFFAGEVTSIYMPNVTEIHAGAFRYCPIKSLNGPKVSFIAGGGIASCHSLATVSLPVLESLGGTAFKGCDALTSLSFPKLMYIGAETFCYCSRLSTLRLNASSVCVLESSGAFSSTKITSTAGYIYVPTSLVAAYKTASEWSYFANRIYGA